MSGRIVVAILPCSEDEPLPSLLKEHGCEIMAFRSRHGVIFPEGTTQGPLHPGLSIGKKLILPSGLEVVQLPCSKEGQKAASFLSAVGGESELQRYRYSL